MDRSRDSSFGSPQPLDLDGSLELNDRASYPTPGEIIGQIGRTILVCLAMGLVARVVVTILGAQ